MRIEPQALVRIDGTHGEGGGALVRTALVMSAVTQQAVKIEEVRGATRYPGLDVEDLTLLRALAEVCQAEVIGAEPGAKAITFIPNSRPRGFKGPIVADRSLAERGPNTLVVLGSLLPVLARSGVYSSLVVDGETFGANSVSYDYFAQVTLPTLKRAGIYAFPELLSAGFGRESKGRVALDVEPSTILGLEWSDRGALRSVDAIVSTSSLPVSIGERIASHMTRMAQNVGLKLQVEHWDVESAGRGAFVTSWATYDRGMGGGTAMGGMGIRPETMAQKAFDQMFEWMSTSTTTDPYLADQILLPLVLSESPSTFSVSHLSQRFLTMVWVVKQFTPIHITVRGVENGPGTVSIQRP